MVVEGEGMVEVFPMLIAGIVGKVIGVESVVNLDERQGG
jgi:hypothetical protein